MYIEIKLLSDTFISSGDSVIDIIDNDIVYDSLGIPYIPAKRIKRVLREAANDLISLKDQYTEDLIKRVFGEIDENSNQINQSIRIDNGLIENFNECKDIILKSKNNKKYSRIFTRDIITESLTTIRNSTSINDNGVAESGTLRKVRALKKGLIFNAEILNISKAEEKFLKDCCKLVQHIGSGVTRGFGNVNFTLKEKQSNSLIKKTPNKSVNSSTKGGYKNENCPTRIKYKINLIDKCLIDKEYISGSTILGILASKYISMVTGKVKFNKEEFNKVFYSDKVKFLNAYPVEKDERSIPIPLNIKEEKNINSNFVYINKNAERQKILSTVNINKINYLQYSKCDNKRENFFAIEDGSVFIGEIIVENDPLKNIVEDLLEQCTNVYIGASKTSEYGKASISVLERTKENEENLSGRSLLFTSPMIIRNENGKYTTKLKDVLSALGLAEEDVASYIFKEVEISGYNAKWGLDKERFLAIKEGSVINFDKKITLQNCYGERKNEGYGQVLLFDNLSKITHKVKDENEVISNINAATLIDEKVFNSFTKQILIKYLKDKIDEDLNKSDKRDNYVKLMNELGKNSSNSFKYSFLLMVNQNNSFSDLYNKISESKNQKLQGLIKFLDVDRYSRVSAIKRLNDQVQLEILRGVNNTNSYNSFKNEVMDIREIDEVSYKQIKKLNDYEKIFENKVVSLLGIDEVVSKKLLKDKYYIFKLYINEMFKKVKYLRGEGL